MSGLKNTFKRLLNFSTGQGYMTGREKRAERDMKRQAALDRVYRNAPIPEAEEIKRNERRKAARRGGSRANTVLTRDTLG